MIDIIAGFACLPIGVFMFLQSFGVTHLDRIFGVPVLLIAAVAIVVLQVANIIDSHVQGHSMLITYGVHLLLLIPAVVYFLSLAITIPSSVMTALPIIFACFIFTEGIYSFFQFA